MSHLQTRTIFVYKVTVPILGSQRLTCFYIDVIYCTAIDNTPKPKPLFVIAINACRVIRYNTLMKFFKPPFVIHQNQNPYSYYQ